MEWYYVLAGSDVKSQKVVQINQKLETLLGYKDFTNLGCHNSKSSQVIDFSHGCFNISRDDKRKDEFANWINKIIQSIMSLNKSPSFNIHLFVILCI